MTSIIITPEIKSKEKFKNTIANLARSDAQHDLGALLNDEFRNSSILNAFNEGLPNPSTHHFNELGSLASVIINANGNSINNITNSPPNASDKLKDAFRIVPDVNNATRGPDAIFNVGVDDPIFSYSVVQFVIPCGNNTPEIREKACQINFGKTFFINTELGGGGNEAAIIVDFSQHHFLEKLVEGEPVPDFKIHYLMTPEVVNDPAGKPNVHNKSLFGAQNGLNLISYVQTDADDLLYTHFDPKDPNPANNFFSNYDFTLSPIKQIYTKKSA